MLSYPLQSQCFIRRQINLPDPTYYLPCVLIPRQPLPPFVCLPREVFALNHSPAMTSIPRSGALLHAASPACKGRPALLLPPGTSEHWLQERISSEPCLPSGHHPLVWLPHQPPCHQSWVIHALYQWPFYIIFQIADKKHRINQG